jgi:transposase-like protein
VHISSEVEECPACGSSEIKSLNLAYVVYRCLDCGLHFEESENVNVQKRVFARKMKNFKFKEEE